jgi:hypothetical protein
VSVTLTGLDGSNPLGFLAALGALRVLDERARREGRAAPAMAWAEEARWIPRLEGVESMDDVVGAVLRDAEAWADEPALAFAYTRDGNRVPPDHPKAIRDLKPRPALMRQLFDEVATRATRGDRRSADMAAAFGTDVATDNNGNVKPTAFHFTAGQQTFLRMAAELRAGLREGHVVEALVGPWEGRSQLPSFSWDSTTARIYALRATDPSGEKRGSVAGANWLALVGVTFFPVAARGVRAPLTPCVDGGWKEAVFTWPLWTALARTATVRALLGLPRLAESAPAERRARTVAAVFQCAISRSDRGVGGFSPAQVR